MMDRNREARRGSMAAGNGGGLSRRRQQRNTNLRDSPEDDGAMEMPESSRLRDRGVKKDRDRDRDRSSSRSKRRRGERLMHASNREDGDESSDESMEDDDDDEDEDASVAVRLPPANSTAMPSSSSSIPQQHQQNHHHVRKSGFPAKPVRPPPASWKAAEEMIGVSIPRKARSSALKRSQECWVSGGGGSGELIHRQSSTSPARPSPPSNTALSPSSSNASARKKKPIGGTKHRPPKMAKSTASSIQEIEIEVAEVLYGMTRHAGPPPATNKQESNKVDSKDTNGLSADAKSRVSSPISSSQAPSTSQPAVLPSSNLHMVPTAPKRKRPRLKFDEESPASPASSVAAPVKPEPDAPQKTVDGSSPRSEKNTSPSPAVENGVGCDPGHPVDMQQDRAKPESGGDQAVESKGLTDDKEQGKVKEDVSILPPMSKEASCVEPSVNPEEATSAAAKTSPASESPREEKFSIDLMAPPLPEKPSSDRDGLPDFVSDHKPPVSEKKMLPDSNIVNGEEKASKQAGAPDHQIAGNLSPEGFESKKQTSREKIHDLQLDLDKHDKDGLSLSCEIKQQQQQMPMQPQPQKSARIDPKQEKTAPAASMALPVPIPGWPGGFPSFGYMGQVPSLQAVVPMDGSSAAAKTIQQPPHFLQPQPRPKRCATHCYIAQNISYHQQLVRMNPFWSSPAAAAAAGTAAPLYGPKQYNLNAVPPSESAAILGNPLQGFPPRSLGPMQDKNAASVAMAFTGLSPKEKSTSTAAANSNNYAEAAQRKQFLLQQTPQPGSTAAPPNMIGPAFIFPISQQSVVANRSGASSKSTPGAGNAAPPAASASSAAAGSGAAGHSPTTVSFNYAGMSPNDAQYMAILQNNAMLQNNAYPFPMAATHVGGPPAYRGASPAQAMPFFNGPFYSSQMVTSQQQHQLMQQQQQLRQQQLHHQQPHAPSQHGHQNPSTSSGSSSSQKHTQQSQQRIPGSGAPSAAVPPGSNSHSHSFPASKQQLHLMPHQARQLESETGCDGSPSTADSSRASQAQKGVYGQNFAMPMHTQNFALISPAAAALAGSGSSGAGGGSHSENKQPGAHQHQQHQSMKVELTPSQAQAYAMSFASFGGSAAAAGAPGFDFSAIVQNPGLLQNMPDITRHGYQIPAAAAVAAAQAAQHKKAHHEEGKAGGGSANAGTEEGKHKTTAGVGGKSGGSIGQQHSLSFSRPDNDPAMSSFTNIFADANSQILNGGRSLIPPSSAAPTTNSAPTATNSPNSHHMQSQAHQQQQQMVQFQRQQQQRMMQLQQHQQQQMQLQQQISRPAKSSTAHTSSSANVGSDRPPAGSAMAARFPQGGLAGFPPALIQGSGPAGQSPQWKASGRAATPAPPATSSSSSAKNQIPQQQQQHHQQQQHQQQMQARSQQQQQPLLNPSAHQTHISFGVTSSNKPLGAATSNPSLSSAAAPAAIAVGFPQSSVSKSSAAAGGGNGGSPRASSNSKPGGPPASVLPTLQLQQQQAAAAASKNSPTSNLKSSSPITSNNRNMTSILGHPHVSPSNSSSSKQQSQQQQQQLQKQSFQQPQLFFNNTYIQAHPSQSNAAAAAAAAGYYHQRRQSEQQPPQQQNSPLSGTSATSDPAKAAAAAAAATGIKGLANQSQAGIMHHTAQYAAAAAAAAATSMAQHPFMSAPFQYIHTMPSSVSVKPASAATAAADQKQSTAGSENSHAWKPEKR